MHSAAKTCCRLLTDPSPPRRSPASLPLHQPSTAFGCGRMGWRRKFLAPTSLFHQFSKPGADRKPSALPSVPHGWRATAKSTSPFDGTHPGLIEAQRQPQLDAEL